MNDTTLLWALVGLGIVAVLIVAVVASRHRARVRRTELQRKFGPEYDRAVEEYGPGRADRELLSRERRVGHFQSRELNAVDRARFMNSWSSIQAQFVDDPGVAVTGANELINEVLRALGYPTEHFEQRVADLSVEHASVVQHYRAAKELADANRNGQVNTEELRQAMVHYRMLFADLLQEPKAATPGLRQAHA
ncbi:MAG TPA: hypothetical protein VJV79_22925 [Polyangiaceae bacterium]|nr:hypothetical protein [Polyangiaceae bacterium]